MRKDYRMKKMLMKTTGDDANWNVSVVVTDMAVGFTYYIRATVAYRKKL